MSVIIESFFKYYGKMVEFSSEQLDLRSEANRITISTMQERINLNGEFIEEIIDSMSNELNSNKIDRLKERSKKHQAEYIKDIKKILEGLKSLSTDTPLWLEEMNKLNSDLNQFMKSLALKIDKKKSMN